MFSIVRQYVPERLDRAKKERAIAIADTFDRNALAAVQAWQRCAAAEEGDEDACIRLHERAVEAERMVGSDILRKLVEAARTHLAVRILDAAARSDEIIQASLDIDLEEWVAKRRAEIA